MIHLLPQRNGITISTFDFQKSIVLDELNNKILEIENLFLLNNIILENNDKINIQITNTNDWSIIFNLKNEITTNIITTLYEDIKLKYFEINKLVLKNLYLEEIYFDKIIKRSAYSFHQNDESIRKILYDNIYKFALSKNFKKIIFLGGEMYLYGKIIDTDQKYFYSDYKSIVDDTVHNNINLKYVKLIDYENKDIKIESGDMILVNNGKSGLGINLCQKILENEYEWIIIISCNNKSFENDYEILNMKYKIINKLEIFTNYLINLIFLQNLRR